MNSTIFVTHAAPSTNDCMFLPHKSLSSYHNPEKTSDSMPSILTDADRETVKRTVPKPANKILAVAVARLYIAYPDKHKWTYSGIQGAVVLANDLIGNTFWLKMVDVSSAGRGVIWDQEIYEPFYYNQDRTFFHSFELEDCLAGLSFVDEKEAKKFKKKMDDREKEASKATKNTPFQSTDGSGASVPVTQEKPHTRFSNLLHGYRSSSSHAQPAQSIIPPRKAVPTTQILPSKPANAPVELDAVDPSWRIMLQDLKAQGITEDQIAQNADFIKSYMQQQQIANVGPNRTTPDEPRSKAPPPPPAIPPGGHRPISPQNTGSTTASRRGAPPAPPATRKARIEPPIVTSPAAQATPPRTPSPPRTRFRVAPPIADAGKYAGSATVPLTRTKPMPAAVPSSGPPPPPPRPSKTPENDDQEGKSKWNVPPAFVDERHGNTPPPPVRNFVPPPPPRSRDAGSIHSIPPSIVVAPPLPPKIPISNTFPTESPPPAPIGKKVPSSVPPAPPRSDHPAHLSHPISTAHLPSPPPPPPPPFPSSNTPPPPPLPAPSTGGPPAPRPPPRGSSSPAAPSLPKSAGERGDLLASIRNVGGGGAGGLRKVKESERRDRSSAALPGSEAAASLSLPTAAVAGGAAAGGVVGSLAAALAARNKKVSASGMFKLWPDVYIIANSYQMMKMSLMIGIKVP